MTKKILFVDDDPNILQSFKRQLRKQYEIDTALCGNEGLEAMKERGPFAVVVSDMQMPEMNGIQFLARVPEYDRDTVRIMLTGNADQRTAVEAVNEGHIFRFLNKPCSPDQMSKALDAGLEQHRLITAEHELLSKTLSGSVSVLTEVLSLVKPRAFGRTAEVRALVRQLCRRVHAENAWEIELAALLAHLGYISVPEETLERVVDGLPLNKHERKIYDNHSQVGSRLVAKIPRLENVAKLIADQASPFDAEDTSLGAHILKLAVDFDALRSTERSDEQVMGIILGRTGEYDPYLVEELNALIGSSYVVQSLNLRELQEGMVLEENVIGTSGEVLIANGRQITPVMLERLRNYAKQRGIREPLRVRISMVGNESAQQAEHVEI